MSHCLFLFLFCEQFFIKCEKIAQRTTKRVAELINSNNNNNYIFYFFKLKDNIFIHSFIVYCSVPERGRTLFQFHPNNKKGGTKKVQ